MHNFIVQCVVDIQCAIKNAMDRLFSKLNPTDSDSDPDSDSESDSNSEQKKKDAEDFDD